MPTGPVLALDLASTTGWAYGDPLIHDVPLAFGTWKLRIKGGANDPGSIFDRFRTEVRLVFRDREVQMVLVEALLPLMALASGRTQEAGLNQIGLNSHARQLCTAYSKVYEAISADMVRDDLLGRHRFPDSKVKDHVVAACRRRGIQVYDHNAADAVLLWLHMQNLRRRGYAA